MKRLLAYVALSAATATSSAGIVAISDTTGATIALTTDECQAMPGWGVARLANGWTTQARGCWQLGDNGAVVTRFPPEWKDAIHTMGTFRWVPNIQFTRTK